MKARDPNGRNEQSLKLDRGAQIAACTENCRGPAPTTSASAGEGHAVHDGIRAMQKLKVQAWLSPDVGCEGHAAQLGRVDHIGLEDKLAYYTVKEFGRLVEVAGFPGVHHQAALARQARPSASSWQLLHLGDVMVRKGASDKLFQSAISC